MHAGDQGPCGSTMHRRVGLHQRARGSSAKCVLVGRQAICARLLLSEHVYRTTSSKRLGARDVGWD